MLQVGSNEVKQDLAIRVKELVQIGQNLLSVKGNSGDVGCNTWISVVGENGQGFQRLLL